MKLKIQTLHDGSTVSAMQIKIPGIDAEVLTRGEDEIRIRFIPGKAVDVLKGNTILATFNAFYLDANLDRDEDDDE